MVINNSLLSLPVVDDGKFLGIVRLSNMGNDRVGEFMISNAPYVRPNSTLYDAWQAMIMLNSRWVPVVKDGAFMGVLTMDSMMKAYRECISQIETMAQQARPNHP